MPNWNDSQGYQRLKQGSYLLDEIILTEKGHYYSQSTHHRLIIANFETHVLVVGTMLARSRWTPEIRHALIAALTHE